MSKSSTSAINAVLKKHRWSEDQVANKADGIQYPHKEATYEEINITPTRDGATIPDPVLSKIITLAEAAALDVYKNNGAEPVKPPTVETLRNAWTIGLEPGEIGEVSVDDRRDIMDFRIGKFIVDPLNTIKSTGDYNFTPLEINVIWYEGTDEE